MKSQRKDLRIGEGVGRAQGRPVEPSVGGEEGADVSANVKSTVRLVVGVYDESVDRNIGQFGGCSTNVRPDGCCASGAIHSLKDVALAIATCTACEAGECNIGNVARGTGRI